MTITVELLNDEALALLQNLERLKILKLLLPQKLSFGKTEVKAAIQAPGQVQAVPPSDSANEKLVKSPNAGFSQEFLPAMSMAKGPVTLPAGFAGPLENYPAGFGGAKGMFVMSPDFDEPLEDFKEYMY